MLISALMLHRNLDKKPFRKYQITISDGQIVQSGTGFLAYVKVWLSKFISIKK